MNFRNQVKKYEAEVAAVQAAKERERALVEWEAEQEKAETLAMLDPAEAKRQRDRWGVWGLVVPTVCGTGGKGGSRPGGTMAMLVCACGGGGVTFKAGHDVGLGGGGGGGGGVVCVWGGGGVEGGGVDELV